MTIDDIKTLLDEGKLLEAFRALGEMVATHGGAHPNDGGSGQPGDPHPGGGPNN